MNYELHPLCTLFPRMAGAEFSALVADIKENGQREPIILHDGLILDGGNRYRACIEAAIEPQVMQFSGGNLVSYVLSANLHRRHMTAGQQAAIVASAQDWAKAQGKGGDRKSDQSAILHFDSAADRATQSGASLRTQKSADKVARENPELAKKVAHGEISLPAAVETVTGKHPAAQSPRRNKAVERATAALTRENEALRQRVDGMTDALEEVPRMARELELLQAVHSGDKETEDLIHDLHKQLDRAEIDLQRMTADRDRLMNDNAALMREVKTLRRENQRLQRVAA